MAISGVLALVIAIIGALHLRHGQGVARAAARSELKAISDLKVAQIVNWRNERLGDARFFSQAHIVARDVLACLANPDSARARAVTLNWLTLLKADDRYEEVVLFDADLVPRLAVPGEIGPVPEILRELLVAALQTDRIVMSDLHRATSGDDIHLDLVFPIRAPTVPGVLGPRSSREARGRPVGALVLHLDPRRFLYPLIQSWPIPSPTAETLLVRREGNDVVYLNELRHRHDSALRLRLPIDRHPDFVAIMAVLGQRGVVEGLDYRGQAVLAAVRDVPDSPWFLVAKVDRDEIYAPIRRQAWLTLLLTAVLAGGLGLAGTLFWQGREAAFAEREWAAERRRLALAERIALLMDHANDVILLLDQEWRIIEANARAVEAYGYSEMQLRGMALRDLRAPATRAAFDEEIRRADLLQGVRLETVHQRKDGTTFPVEISFSTVEIDGRRFHQEIARDITERKQAEAALLRLNRDLRTICICNQALVRASTEDELLREVCRIVVEVGGYRMAWVGYAEQDTAKSVWPVAVAGFDEGYVAGLHLTWADEERGRGLTGTAIRTGAPCFVGRIATDPRLELWREEAMRRGYASSIALPLKAPDGTFGALHIYAAEPDAFDPKEVELLMEMAGDLAYGIRAIRIRAAHARALCEIESLARFASENPNPVLRVREDGTVLYANAPTGPLLAEWGIQVGDPLPAREWNLVRHALAAMAVIEQEIACVGRTFSILYVPIGGQEYVNLYGRDITARKRAEAASLESRNALQTMIDMSPLAIVVTDCQGIITLWNEAAERIFAWSEQETLGKPNPIIPPDKAEEVKRVRSEILHGKTFVGYETERLRKDGTRIAVSFSATALRGTGGAVTGILAIMADITDRKRLERERVSLEAQLRQQQKLEAIGTLAGGVAHEINNPITGIMNYAQLIGDAAPAGSQTAEYAQEIVRETERVATIVRNLLQFARQETQAHSPARIADIIEQTLSLFRAVLRRDQITLDVDVPDDLPALKCRSQQIQQVLMNLLTNARDALNEKYPGYHPEKTISITVREVGGDCRSQIADCRLNGTGTPNLKSEIADLQSLGRRWLRLTVADRGNGIPVEIQPRIFDPFFTTKPRDQGTGLGLSISHGIVKDHHGVLHFETEPGTGTQFHLDLPVDNEWAAEEERQEAGGR